MTKKSTTEKLKKRVSRTSSKIASVSRDAGENDKKSDSIAFSIDDVEALVATRASTGKAAAPKKQAKRKTTVVEKKAKAKVEPSEKRVLGAASLSDILGFNPTKKESQTSLEETSIPTKWKKYYKLLVHLVDYDRLSKLLRLYHLKN